ncbi:MAG: redoxin domain-containing protein [Planctomycetes bacterium]|nr:redoxin domain-containing protein [Planctomycetota bacterium]
MLERNAVPIRSALVLFVAAGALATSPALAGDKPAIGTSVGEMYPDFRLPSLDGGFKRLSDYRGKKVLLLHFASW